MNPTGVRAPGLEPALREEIRAGLTDPRQKRLPSRLLYDALGSALFEAIGFLPEYGLTRADERILRTHARQIVQSIPGPMVVAELGSGGGRKTRWLLDEGGRHRPSLYIPIDISAAALARCTIELNRTGVRIEPIEADYLSGLTEAAKLRGGGRLLVLFLGSTIGNFEPEDARRFLRDVRARLQTGDAFLLGTDLVKPEPQLVAAYDDALGITAAFDRNILARLNRELEADFDLTLFAHEARWNAGKRRIEMHLVASRPHVVHLRALDLRIPFLAGESIWTESSYKYELEEVRRLGAGAGFALERQWVDPEWPFAETLFSAR